MKRLEFFVYVDFGSGKAKVLKTCYATGVNEYVVKLVVEAPDLTPMTVVTVQVPSVVVVGDVQIVEPRGVNQALIEGWVSPAGTLDRDGHLQLEFTRKGLEWLFGLEREGVYTGNILRSYGLDSALYPQWLWDMTPKEREALRQGQTTEEEETP